MIDLLRLRGAEIYLAEAGPDTDELLILPDHDTSLSYERRNGPSWYTNNREKVVRHLAARCIGLEEPDRSQTIRQYLLTGELNITRGLIAEATTEHAIDRLTNAASQGNLPLEQARVQAELVLAQDMQYGFLTHQGIVANRDFKPVITEAADLPALAKLAATSSNPFPYAPEEYDDILLRTTERGYTHLAAYVNLSGLPSPLSYTARDNFFRMALGTYENGLYRASEVLPSKGLEPAIQVVEDAGGGERY